MKKQLALALLLAGSVSNASLAMADAASTGSTSTQAAQENNATGTSTEVPGRLSKVTEYLVGKKNAAVAQAKAHPYIASTAAVAVVLGAAYKFSATFRRLIGRETQEDMNKRFSAFEI